MTERELTLHERSMVALVRLRLERAEVRSGHHWYFLDSVDALMQSLDLDGRHVDSAAVALFADLIERGKSEEVLDALKAIGQRWDTALVLKGGT